MALAAPNGQAGGTETFRFDRAGVAGYDAAVAALRSAVAAIAADDVEARCAAVRAATEAVTTLYLSLDASRHGELAEPLGHLYGAILGRLLRVNLYNDARIAEQVIGLLEPLHPAAAAPSGGHAAALHPK